MKRLFILLALVCAPMLANAQLSFTSPTPELKVEKIGSVRLGSISVKHDNFGYYLAGRTEGYGEIIIMILGEDKLHATWTMKDLKKLYNLEDGQSRTFINAKMYEYRATKAGNNRIRIRRRGDRGFMTLTRNECDRLAAKLAAYNPN